MLKHFLVVVSVLACAFATAQDDVVAGRDANQRNAPMTAKQFKESVAAYDNNSTLPSEKCNKVSESKIRYILYTREKPQGEVVTANPSNLSDSSINVKKSLKVIVHAWTQNSAWAKPMVRDYLYSQNVDVLVLDWSAYSELCDLESTTTAVIPVLGESLAHILGQIISIGHCSDNMHLIGFSHGAHIVGIAGRKMVPHLPARISALDPIYLKEIGVPTPNKLTASDAKFIDVIKTSLPSLSFYDDLGLATFYPNGGFVDYHPNCAGIEDYKARMVCGHALSYKLFAESLASPKKFCAYRCESYSKFLAGRCNNTQTAAHMGEFVEMNARGNYYLSTSKDSPFDKGVKSCSQTNA